MLKSLALWMANSKYFFKSIQIFNFFLFILLIVGGLHFVDAVSDIVWLIWWPFLITLGLFSIRLWCAVCPLKLSADIGEFFTRNIKLPMWVVKNRVFITAISIYLVHSILVSGCGIPRSDYRTGWYLIVILSYAFLIGFLFSKNNFCRIFCPLSGMLRIFTKMSWFGFEVKDKKTCFDCKEKTCFHNCSVQIVATILPENSCNFCTQCIKTCPYNNVTIAIQTPEQKKSFEKLLNWGEFAIITVLLGISIETFLDWTFSWSIFTTSWQFLENWIMYVPDFFYDLGLPRLLLNRYEWIYSAWMYAGIPSLVLWSFGGILKTMFPQKTFKELLFFFTPAFIPVIFTVFLAGLTHKFFVLILPQFFRYSGENTLFPDIFFLGTVYLGLLYSLFLILKKYKEI